jgi:hypothetical protein
LDKCINNNSSGITSIIPDSVFQKQIQERINNPAAIDQGYTNLCGMAVCAMTLVKYDPAGYTNILTELNNNQKTFYKNYKLNAKKRVARFDKNFFKTGQLPEVDWLLLANMRNKSNLILPYGGRMLKCYEKLSGSNFPRDVRRILKKMGFEKTGDNMNGFYPIRKPATQTLQDLETAFKNGHTPIILINTRMYKSGKFSIKSNHFAIYNGNLTFDSTNNKVSFNIWTFGYKSGKNISCSLKAFRNNYFGSIVVKKPD